MAAWSCRPRVLSRGYVRKDAVRIYKAGEAAQVSSDVAHAESAHSGRWGLRLDITFPSPALPTESLLGSRMTFGA